MGVDARIEFTTPKPLTELELRQASGRLFATVGKGPFWLEKKDNQHILEAIEANRYQVNLIGRYYGPGYERGPLVDYITIANWLEVNLGATVYYGNDSSDELGLFDDNYVSYLYHYYLENGHEPYRAYSLGTKETPKCSFCGGKPMHAVGCGGNHTFWHCDGCATQLITEPNKDPVEVEEFF